MKEIAHTWAWSSAPIDDASLNAMMISLDSHLIAHNVPITARQLIGGGVASIKLGYSGTPLWPMPDEQPEPWSPGDILDRVSRWFDRIYGDKLAVDYSPGSTCVPLRGELWELQIPRLFGSSSIFASRNIGDEGIIIGRKGPISTNVVRAVQGLTQELANSLTDQELALIADSYLQGFKAARSLDRMPDDLLFQQAYANYRHSVAELVRRNGAYGNSRRETSLCCEKILKGVLARLRKTYPTRGRQAHDVIHLGQLVFTGTVYPTPLADLEAIACSPDVSYLRAVRLDEALEAHKALRRVLALLDPGGMPCEIVIGGRVATSAPQVWLPNW